MIDKVSVGFEKLGPPVLAPTDLGAGARSPLQRVEIPGAQILDRRRELLTTVATGSAQIPLTRIPCSFADTTFDRRVRCAAVASWGAIEQAEPEFAGRVRRLFDAGRHKTIATLRADGSPRISGIECEFTTGDLRFGSMTDARKGADLRRDPRFALHGPTFHPVEGKESDWPGEAKIAGRAIAAGQVAADQANEQPDGEMFVADIIEVVITALNAEATKLVVESWTPGRGLQRVERD